MRNIKFRGFSKNLTNNEWVYGDLVNYSETEKIIVEQNSKTWDLLEGGIILATRKFKSEKGTIEFLSRTMATPELEHHEEKEILK